MLKQLVLDTIKKHELIKYGDGVVVGISGGYDSVCLLHILYSLTQDYNLKLYPVHINHLLRGEEALRDEEFVKAFCAALGLEVHVERIDIAQKAKAERLSLEEAGRDARYGVFHRVLESRGATKIAVAHSKNDQVETLLMRIFRGTGPEGLKGIEYKRDAIIRPLLDADRSQIEEYVNLNSLEAIIDSSNLHTDYFRNRIRLKVIPEINSAVGSDITENLLRLSKIIVADEEFLRYNSELYYKKAKISQENNSVKLSISKVLPLHPAICSRVLRIAFNEAAGSVTGLEHIHVEKLQKLISEGRTGTHIDLPLGMAAERSYEHLIFQKQVQFRQQVENFDYCLQIPGKLELRELKSVIETKIIQPEEIVVQKGISMLKYQAFFDFEKISTEQNYNIVVRNRRDGDIFKPLKSNGTKKLKEYFIDNKIPKNQRNSIPLIAINKEIIWIIGNKTSDNYKVTDNTKSVLMITFNSKNIE